MLPFDNVQLYKILLDLRESPPPHTTNNNHPPPPTLPLLFVYFQVNNGVLYFLDYEDPYIMALSVLVSM